MIYQFYYYCAYKAVTHDRINKTPKISAEILTLSVINFNIVSILLIVDNIFNFNILDSFFNQTHIFVKFLFVIFEGYLIDILYAKRFKIYKERYDRITNDKPIIHNLVLFSGFLLSCIIMLIIHSVYSKWLFFINSYSISWILFSK